MKSKNFKSTKSVIGICFLFLIVLNLFAEEKIISDFENIDEWEINLISGNKQFLSISLSEDSIHGKNSYKINYIPTSLGKYEIEISKKVEIFGNFDRIEFWVKGFSGENRYSFFVADKEGNEKEFSFVPDFLLYDIFTPEWRRITIKKEEGIVKWDKIEKIGFRVKSVNPSQEGVSLQIDFLCLYEGPPSLKLKIPDEFKHKENGKLDILIVSADIVQELERWNLENVIREKFKEAEIKKVKYAYIPWLYKGSLIGSFPSFHRKIREYDIIILKNWDTDAIDKTYQMLIKDYVEGGGNLLIIGGYYSFNSSKLENTILGDLMPFETSLNYFDIKKQKKKLTSTLFKTLEGKNVFYYHKINPKKNSETLLKDTKGEPLIIFWKWGEGKIMAISLTTLGSKEDMIDSQPFWEGGNYKDFIFSLINYLTGGKI